jgi:hypothetical protein
MAEFRIREDALTWLADVQRTLPNCQIFDLYYFCSMAGLVSGRAEELSAPSREMVDYFINDYKPAESFVIGMLVVAELKRGRIDFNEEGEVRSVFRSLVDGAGNNPLTTEGMNRLNAYANGGYEYLAQKIDHRPQSAEEFLRFYAEVIDETVQGGPFAQ